MRRIVLLAIAVLATTGCAPVGPDFVRPEADVGIQWSDYAREEFQFEPQDSVAWWQILEDPVLNGLVWLSHQQNNKIKSAG